MTIIETWELNKGHLFAIVRHSRTEQRRLFCRQIEVMRFDDYVEKLYALGCDWVVYGRYTSHYTSVRPDFYTVADGRDFLVRLSPLCTEEDCDAWEALYRRISHKY